MDGVYLEAAAGGREGGTGVVVFKKSDLREDIARPFISIDFAAIKTLFAWKAERVRGNNQINHGYIVYMDH